MLCNDEENGETEVSVIRRKNFGRSQIFSYRETQIKRTVNAPKKMADNLFQLNLKLESSILFIQVVCSCNFIL